MKTAAGVRAPVFFYGHRLARPFPADPAPPPLLDERDLCPGAAPYPNSSYFDETYHARPPPEHIENISP